MAGNLPSAYGLIRELGSQELLKVMVNADGFEYRTNSELELPYREGVITPGDYHNSIVQFSMGFKKRWVCVLIWHRLTYGVYIRPLPTTASDHLIHKSYCRTISELRDTILAVTGLSISFS
jgi:hypothetical protein